MGLRFKKSVKIAPGVKVNFNKKSVGVTVGGKGAHYTINSKGRKTTSVGIPGTGLSYVSTSGDSSKKQTDSTKRTNTYSNTTNNNYSPNGNGEKWYQKTGWIIFWLIAFFPVGLFLMWKYSNWNKIIKTIISIFFVIGLIGSFLSPDLESITLTADTSTIHDINDTVKIKMNTTPEDFDIKENDFVVSGGSLSFYDKKIIFTADKPGKYNVCVRHSDVESNTLVFEYEDKTAIAEEKKAEREAEKERLAEEASAQAAAQAQQPQEQMVWVSGSGSKYHSNSSCSGMKNPQQVTLSEAKNAGLEPCKKCH